MIIKLYFKVYRFNSKTKQLKIFQKFKYIILKIRKSL